MLNRLIVERDAVNGGRHSNEDPEDDIETLRKKVEFNELRARDVNARVTIVESELKLLELRPKLRTLRRET